MLAAVWQAHAQDSKAPYPTMASLDQYLPRKAQIALARSAAPESISPDAEIMVLGQHGYATGQPGQPVLSPD
jgi:hypothetical protein